MTTFKEISGQLIRTLSSDPANPQEGQIWYNSTIGVLKGYEIVAAAWASGGNLTTARAQVLSNSRLLQVVTPATSYSHNSTEEYDGSSWTGGNLWEQQCRYK
jgi:hypothetical protein